MIMQTYLSSKYNFLIPIPEKRLFILFNALYSGLYELSEEEGELVSELFSKPAFDLEGLASEHFSMIERLIAFGYIIESEKKERELLKRVYNQANQYVRTKNPFRITILPTLACNLGCRYCFQNGAKAVGMSEDSMKQISTFLKKQLDQTGRNGQEGSYTQELSVTWYGGEPTLAFKQIQEFTPILISMAKEYGLKYHADMITNGTMLTPEVFSCFRDLHIEHIQVTLDGSQTTHDHNRPMKSGTKSSYMQILENLQHLPEDVRLTIRINTDKQVWRNIEVLLSDLECHEIWPQKYNQVNLALAKVTPYENARYHDSSAYMTSDEFYVVDRKFAELKYQRFNRWAVMAGKKLAKKQFYLPQVKLTECSTAVSQNGFVFDPEGYINKCWTDVDKPATHIGHVTAPGDLNQKKLKKWIEYDRFQDTECPTCKFMPICEEKCTRTMLLDQKKSCFREEKILISILHDQYIDMLDNPGKYAPLK